MHTPQTVSLAALMPPPMLRSYGVSSSQSSYIINTIFSIIHEKNVLKQHHDLNNMCHEQLL